MAVLSSTFDGSYEPVKEICEALDAFVGIREGGWQLPAYTFPEHRTDLAALRVVVRRGFTHDTADLLLRDLKRLLPRMERQPAPVHDGTGATGFHH